MHKTIVISVLCLLGSLSTGCGSACEDLAYKVCRCQSTRVKQDRCRYSVRVAVRNTDISDEREDACESILDSGKCTCEAVVSGDTAACGLSTESPEILFDNSQEILH